MGEIEKKIVELRKKWKVEPANRKIIELQAKLLEMGKTAKKNVEEAIKIFE